MDRKITDIDVRDAFFGELYKSIKKDNKIIAQHEIKKDWLILTFHFRVKKFEKDKIINKKIKLDM